MKIARAVLQRGGAAGVVAPQSKIHEGYSPSSLLAIHPAALAIPFPVYFQNTLLFVQSSTSCTKTGFFAPPHACGGEGEAQEPLKNGASPPLSNELTEKFKNAKNAKIRAILSKDCLVEKPLTEANGVNGGKLGNKSSVGRVASLKKCPPRLTGNMETFSSGLHYKKFARRHANRKPETKCLCKSLQRNDVTCYQKQYFLLHMRLQAFSPPLLCLFVSLRMRPIRSWMGNMARQLRIE